jgi:protein-S-isoprenylcysteine O-methyltransferase Ste14
MIWRLFFFVIYILFFLIRFFYKGKQSKREESVDLQNLKLALQREGKLNMYARSALSLIMFLSIPVYVIYPSWLLIFNLAFPDWLRFIALCSALMTLPFLRWAHCSLGKQYSPHLELIKEHQLITDGLYKIIRHPMYTFLIIFMLSISVLAANLVIIVPHLTAIVLLLLRLNKEEAMLLDKFGDVYNEYMKKTGRLLPKFN